MSLASLFIASSSAFGFIAIASFFAIVLWFILRVKQQRIWLPILRVIEVQPTILPKFKLVFPPFIPTFCFIVSALTLLFYSLKPQKRANIPYDPHNTRYHFFVDLSPSISASQSYQEYVDRIVTTWQQVEPRIRKTISTSSHWRHYEPKTLDELKKYLLSQGFHRAGLELGDALKKQLEELGDIDQLLIISDRDGHTWENFHWRYLLKQMDVYFLDVSTIAENSRNLFINNIKPIIDTEKHDVEWDVELSRRGPWDEASGVIKASIDEKELVSTFWNFAKNQKRIRLRIKTPYRSVEELGAKPTVLWQISPETPDVLAMDNEFRTFYHTSNRSHVLLVADPEGESSLEDPAHQLQISLDILGFAVDRRDWLHYGDDLHRRQYPLNIFFLDDDSMDNCPLAMNTSTGNPQSSPQKIWLSTYKNAIGYQALCHCFDRLHNRQDSTEGLDKVPVYCQEIRTLEVFNRTLKALGAQPVGGKIGEDGQTLAWIGSHLAEKREIIVFTRPLRPSRATGMTHGQMPLLIKSLLQWQELYTQRAASVSSWSRLGNIVHSPGWQEPLPTESNRPLTQRNDLALSNVPRGESFLHLLAAEDLPPPWYPKIRGNDQNTMSQEQMDPQPWIRFCCLLIIFMFIIEIIWGLKKAMSKKPQNFNPSSWLWLIIMAWSFTNGELRAQLQVQYLTTNKKTMNFKRISQDTIARTSLEVKEAVSIHHKITPSLLAEGWIWSSSTQLITQKDHTLQPAIIRWLKKGGFLIVSDRLNDLSLEKLTRQNFARKESEQRWSPIPPDHEIMRSFYLLDSLPSCGEFVWKGFLYDGRLAILMIPFDFIDVAESLANGKDTKICGQAVAYEKILRLFINMTMVALTTNYKRDQIHMKQILKRLH